jgi:tRNA threonylcarbamoyladenosine biosynthesis protein TsaB
VSLLAIESATDHAEVLVRGDDGAIRSHVRESIGQGHTRRLAGMVDAALREAGVAPRALRRVCVDLGPGSFTGVRVGLATARALALASGAEVRGASSLASLALASGVRGALVIPLVPAGRRDVYAGFFRADARGSVRTVAAPEVGTLALVVRRVEEAMRASGLSRVRFVGPGAGREYQALETFQRGSTSPAWRHEGLSALDLAEAAESKAGVAAGLPGPDEPPAPLYVRPAQAEERVRRRALAGETIPLRPMSRGDLATIATLERRIFSDPWPESFFVGELGQPLVYARVAERGSEIVGYAVSWLGAGAGHLGNLAVIPEQRRRGVARRLLEDLLDRARALMVKSLTLEVRASNAPAQALYRVYGFRLAGLRRGYYRDTGEDALVMEWRSDEASPTTSPQ